MTTRKWVYWVCLLLGLPLVVPVFAFAATGTPDQSKIGTAIAADAIQSGTADMESVGSKLQDTENAADTKMNKMNKMKKKAANLERKHTRQMTGRITAIDTATNSLTVQKGKKEPVTIHLTEKTRILSGKEPKALSDLKVGDKVKLRVGEEGGREVARTIHLKTEEKGDEAPEQ